MFKFGDLIIYGVILGIFLSLNFMINSMPKSKGQKVEIYVNDKLSYVYKLQEEQKIVEIPTDIGGVEVEIKEMKVRVISSYSPRKLCVKQGWIERAGQTIIGVPDRLIVKVVGGEEEELDGVIR